MCIWDEINDFLLLFYLITDLQVHRSMNCPKNCRVVFSTVLVASLNRHRFPIGPVNVILEHGQRKDVLKMSERIGTSGEDDSEVGSVEVDGSDVILSGVAEEQLTSGVVDGQGVRPAEVRFQND